MSNLQLEHPVDFRQKVSQKLQHSCIQLTITHVQMHGANTWGKRMGLVLTMDGACKINMMFEQIKVTGIALCLTRFNMMVDRTRV